jgi:hypothetical protein
MFKFSLDKKIILYIELGVFNLFYFCLYIYFQLDKETFY